MRSFQGWLRHSGACMPGRAFVGNMPAAEAWAAIPRGDWLLWWLDSLLVTKAEQFGIEFHRKTTLAAMGCAHPAYLRLSEAIEAKRDRKAFERAWHLTYRYACGREVSKHVLDDARKQTSSIFDCLPDSAVAYNFVFLLQETFDYGALHYPGVCAVPLCIAWLDSGERAPFDGALSERQARILLDQANRVRKLVPWELVRSTMREQGVEA